MTPFEQWFSSDFHREIKEGVPDDRSVLSSGQSIHHAKATKVDRAGSKHPTVEPIGLMEHLIRHVTPPGGVVLDPFAGSGTTGAAAQRLGFDCILMEQDADYARFLRGRFDLPRGFTMDADLRQLLGL